MRLRTTDAPYIARKIGIDLVASSLVVMSQGLDAVVLACQTIVEQDIAKETAVDLKVKELLNQNEEEIDFLNADAKQLFWMVKKKIASECGLILDREERFSNIAHLILDDIWNEDLMDYSVSETIIKNIIVKAMFEYIRKYDDIEKSVAEKVANYKRKLVPGSEEYEMVVSKLFEEELKKRGML